MQFPNRDQDPQIEEPLLASRHSYVLRPPRVISACVLTEGLDSDAKVARYKKTQRKFVWALALAFFFMFVEVTGGIYAGSLAIITDAAHLLSDISGFAVSIAAAYYAAQKTSESHHFSYGFHRVEVLGALASILSVWLVTGILVFEAVQRIFNPEPVDGKIMFILSIVGIFVNVALMVILGGHGHSHGGHSHSHGGHSHDDHDHDHNHDHHHHDDMEHGASQTHSSQTAHNINEQGAIIHVLGDLVQSVGVAIAGALIWWKQDDPRWALADPICTFVFAILVLWTTMTILKDIAYVLMERAPPGIDVAKTLEYISHAPGVIDVHDFHCWSLTPGIPLLCAHVVASQGTDSGEVLRYITAFCKKIGIDHVTIQVHVVGDEGGCPCGN